MSQAAVSFLNDRVRLFPGDCLDVLKTIPENSIDSAVMDPPYHLTSIVKRFGGKNSAVAQFGKDGAFLRASAGFMGKQWDGGDIAFRVELWAEVLRILKPGAYLIAFSSTRTFGRMQVAIEESGFVTHPFVAWIFGSGFPKAHKVQDPEWDGWAYGGQALKPAIEPIYMGQKPFSEKNGTLNIQRWGVGALNINDCRVGNAPGRWPANVILDGSDSVLNAFPNAPGQLADASTSSSSRRTQNVYGTMKRGNGRHGEASAHRRYNESGSTNFAALPGTRREDGGGSAARFFYSAKADAEDRLGSKHPTVKPLDLMQYLVRLVTPKGGTVLDCFAGTGTTGEAAWREGMSAILIEREVEYQADIARRMDLADKPTKRAAVAKSKNNLDNPNSLPLFGAAE